MKTYPSPLSHSVSPLEPTQEINGLTHESNLETAAGILIEELEVSATSESELAPPSNSSFQWKVFGTTFVTIFLAELGDKTQVSTLLMSAQFHAPWIVFTGAAAALISTSLLGVLAGRWLSTRFSAKALDRAAGIILALIAIGLVWDVIQS